MSTEIVKPLKIALDARPLNVEHLRGMGRYAREIVERLGNERTVEWRLFGDNPSLPIQLPTSQKWPVYLHSIPGYRFASWEQMLLPIEAVASGADLLHCTATSAPVWQPIPTVITIHDTLPWSKNGWSPGPYRDFIVPKAYQRAKAIITISDHSKRDILALWPELGAKLHVVHHGISDAFLSVQPRPDDALLSTYRIRAPYILYVGGDLPRKRFRWALDLWNALGDQRPRLVAAGIPVSAHQQFRDLVPSERQAEVIFLPFVADDWMPRLYQAAAVVLYPTLYEGFGFPALEAQAAGTPVLLGDVSSLRELAGPGAVVLPADDFNAWLVALKRVLQERSEAPGPIEKARSWASRFSWATSARKHLEIYQSIARGKK